MGDDIYRMLEGAITMPPSNLLPPPIAETRLAGILCRDPSLCAALVSLREISASIAGEAGRVVPSFTDHSVLHMDKLWFVADEVLTEGESARFSPAEAFLLGSAFYLHDLGMAFAATAEGVAELRASKQYKTAHQYATGPKGLTHGGADAFALSMATRERHAIECGRLATDLLPGIKRYLIETTDIRRQAADLLGTLAASHHWSLREVSSKFGQRHASLGEHTIDLAYLACVLRIVDYAHINRDRASSLSRAMRISIDNDSQLHWDAQEHIVGPKRYGTELAYSSDTPLSNIDAWWLFHDMASGLDREIREVCAYLEDRLQSTGRFTLKGVLGIHSPESFAQHVQLVDEIQPVDVRVQADSMDRLIAMLGGKELYGHDKLAPLRELLQNSVDALRLRRADEKDASQLPPPLIKVMRTSEEEHRWLTVEDNGIGMTRNTLIRYLLGVASQFWQSLDFYKEFPNIGESAFVPIGRFGIGFLSVFMVADAVEVVTAKKGRPQLCLQLSGLGRRGKLKEQPTTGWIGTRIRARLKPECVELFDNLADVVCSRVPMLECDIRIVEDDQPAKDIIAGWWARASEGELRQFIDTWRSTAMGWRAVERRPRPRRTRNYNANHQLFEWPDGNPSHCANDGRTWSDVVDGGGVIVCSLGVAVNVYACGDIAGVVDIGKCDLDPSRSRIVTDEPRPQSVVDHEGMDRSGRYRMPATYENVVRAHLRPHVAQSLGRLHLRGLMPCRFGMVRSISVEYGKDICLTSPCKWIQTLDAMGDAKFRSAPELTDLLSGAPAVVLASNASSAELFLNVHAVSANKPHPVIISIPEDELSISYSTKQQLAAQQGDATVLRGTLDEILQKIEYERECPHMLSIIIEIVAKSFGITSRQVRSQEWRFNMDSTSIWVAIDRP